MDDILHLIKDKLVVSCQAQPQEPLHSSFIMGRMALAAKEGGAVAIRAEGVEDIREIKKVTGLPVIGLIKRSYPDSDIYISPTAEEVRALIDSGCEMIALDATLRVRPGGESLEDLIRMIKAAGLLVLADISTFEEACEAQALGADCVSTTLSGYTEYTPVLTGPDLALIEKLHGKIKIPVLAEGRINTPEELKAAYRAGAYAAIVGSAITRPQLITAKFTAALPE